jgi:predicted nucleic acid-binding protein
VGLLRAGDQHHARAAAWQHWRERRKVTVVTTEAVLWECLNLASAVTLRGTAIGFYRHCHADPAVKVIKCVPRLMQAAVDLYQSRDDKAWGVTDCLSFLVMQERALANALTTDHHFIQAGFRALLLEEPPAWFIVERRP